MVGGGGARVMCGGGTRITGGQESLVCGTRITCEGDKNHMCGGQDSHVWGTRITFVGRGGGAKITFVGDKNHIRRSKERYQVYLLLMFYVWNLCFDTAVYFHLLFIIFSHPLILLDLRSTILSLLLMLKNSLKLMIMGRSSFGSTSMVKATKQALWYDTFFTSNFYHTIPSFNDTRIFSFSHIFFVFCNVCYTWHIKFIVCKCC